MQISNTINNETAGTGLRCALNILTKWELTQNQKKKILRISGSLLKDAQKNIAFKPNLDTDQLLRISMILDIHASLRSIFQNDANVYKFMSLKNSNNPFNDNSPIEIILRGNIITMHHVCCAIRAISLIGSNPLS